MATETREASPAHFLFKIESFSLLNKRGVDKYETREFEAGNFKWSLVIYPNGQGIETAGEYVSVYLAISGTESLPENWEVNAVFSIFILNQISGTYLHTPGKTSRFFALKKEWGIPKFISKKDLTVPSNGYLVDDSCLFGAEVCVINKCNPVTECLSLKNAIVPVKHSIKVSNFSTLKNTWESEEFNAAGIKWKINIYPTGIKSGAGNSISVYLVHVPSNNIYTKVKADFIIFMKNQLKSTKDHMCTASHWFRAAAIDWGWSSFISLAQLNDKNGGFIVKDTCLFEIEISVHAIAAQ